MDGSRRPKHVVILGICKIITDGEHIPGHLTRLDAGERRNGTGQVQRAIFPGGELSVRARDRHGLGRCRSGRRITNVLTTSSELASGTGRKLRSGAHRRIGLAGGGGGVVGYTLRGNYEGVKGVVLTRVKRMRMWKRIAFVVDLCLRGKI
jgi:hypothetical protein